MEKLVHERDLGSTRYRSAIEKGLALTFVPAHVDGAGGPLGGVAAGPSDAPRRGRSATPRGPHTHHVLGRDQEALEGARGPRPAVDGARHRPAGAGPSIPGERRSLRGHRLGGFPYEHTTIVITGGGSGNLVLRHHARLYRLQCWRPGRGRRRGFGSVCHMAISNAVAVGVAGGCRPATTRDQRAPFEHRPERRVFIPKPLKLCVDLLLFSLAVQP